MKIFRLKPVGDLRKKIVQTCRRTSEKDMSKSAEDLQERICPNLQEIFGKR
jgi:hypothetical protein